MLLSFLTRCWHLGALCGSTSRYPASIHIYSKIYNYLYTLAFGEVRKPRQRRWGVLFPKMSTYFPILLYYAIVIHSISHYKHFPKRCDLKAKRAKKAMFHLLLQQHRSFQGQWAAPVRKPQLSFHQDSPAQFAIAVPHPQHLC